MKCKTFTDGGSRGNPGPAGIGGVVFSVDDEVLAEVSEFIGIETNNVAEYQALVSTLEAAQKLGATEIDCYLDSQLVVKQMNREYRVKHEAMKPLFARVSTLVVEIGIVRFHHVRREYNTHADRLVNDALDAATG